VEAGADRIQTHRRELVRDLDEQVRNISGGGAEQSIDELRLFLQRRVLPLAEAHQFHLIPALERVSGHAFETASMALDCETAKRYVTDVEEIMYKLETRVPREEREQLESDLIVKVTRLQAVVELVVDKESRIYLPQLHEHFSGDERTEILRALVERHRVILLPDSERI